MITRTSFIEINKKWVIFLLALFLLSPTSIPLLNKVLCLIFFSIMFWLLANEKDIAIITPPQKPKLPPLTATFIVLSQFICAEYSARYYTGSGLLEALSGLFSGKNNYSSYQSYFLESGIAQFSASKIPAILASAFVKGTFILCYSLLISGNESNKTRFLILLTALPPVLTSISRGTFFEVFEVALCIFYFIKTKEPIIKKKPTLRTARRSAFFTATGLILIVLFVINASRRYEENSLFFSHSCATKDFCFTPYGVSFLAEYGIYILSGYFSTGIYFLSEYFRLLLEGEFTESLIPMASTSLFEEDSISLSKKLCTSYIDCGAAWHPEIFRWISIFGLTLIPIIAPIAYRYFVKIERHILSRANAFSLPTCYFMLVYVISVPVGNFYTTSSSNIICSIAFFILWARCPKALPPKPIP